MEWKGPEGAKVGVDYPHYNVKDGQWIIGPDVPHVGWRIGIKNKTVGHIWLDDVPYNR